MFYPRMTDLTGYIFGAALSKGWRLSERNSRWDYADRSQPGADFMMTMSERLWLGWVSAQVVMETLSSRQ